MKTPDGLDARSLWKCTLRVKWYNVGQVAWHPETVYVVSETIAVAADACVAAFLCDHPKANDSLYVKEARCESVERVASAVICPVEGEVKTEAWRGSH